MKQTVDVICLDLPAEHKYLSVLSVCISEMLAHVKISERDITVHKVQLAAHEIAANIVEHACLDERDSRIDVTLMLEGSPCRFLIKLHATGQHVFDPSGAAFPNLEEGQVHGYGLFLVPQLVDEVTTMLKPGDNHWYLVKNL